MNVWYSVVIVVITWVIRIVYHPTDGCWNVCILSATPDPSLNILHLQYVNRAVKLPWIFFGAPLIFYGALGNIQGVLDRYVSSSQTCHRKDRVYGVPHGSSCPLFKPANSCSLAGVSVNHCLADFALDMTAPHKLAVASFHLPLHVCVVAPATAEQVAGVWTMPVGAALATLCAHHTSVRVPSTEIRRLIHVDEFIAVDGPFAHRTLSSPESTLGSWRDRYWVFVAIFEVVSDDGERRHGHPTGLDSARAWHSMTTATDLLLFDHRLKQNNKAINHGIFL